MLSIYQLFSYSNMMTFVLFDHEQPFCSFVGAYSEAARRSQTQMR